MSLTQSTLIRFLKNVDEEAWKPPLIRQNQLHQKMCAAIGSLQTHYLPIPSTRSVKDTTIGRLSKLGTAVGAAWFSDCSPRNGSKMR